MEDETLYRRATEIWNELEPLWTAAANPPVPHAIIAKDMSKFQQFDQLDHERARLFAAKLLDKMRTQNTDTSLLICRGNLPEYICVEFAKRQVSYCVVEPAVTSPSSIEAYKERMRRQREIFKDR